MSEDPPHRKRIRHYDVAWHAHLLTFSCYHGIPLLVDSERMALLSRYIDRSKKRHGFKLIAFVYMPDHAHLLVYTEREDTRVSRLLYGIKKPYADEVKRRMSFSGNPILKKLTVTNGVGKSVFRFWQAGPGHDRNLMTLESIRKAAEYMHNNPVRRPLCRSVDQWRWSSWRHYYRPELPRDPSLPTIDGFPC